MNKKELKKEFIAFAKIVEGMVELASLSERYELITRRFEMGRELVEMEIMVSQSVDWKPQFCFNVLDRNTREELATSSFYEFEEAWKEISKYLPKGIK